MEARVSRPHQVIAAVLAPPMASAGDLFTAVKRLRIDFCKRFIYLDMFHYSLQYMFYLFLCVIFVLELWCKKLKALFISMAAERRREEDSFFSEEECMHWWHGCKVSRQNREVCDLGMLGCIFSWCLDVFGFLNPGFSASS